MYMYVTAESPSSHRSEHTYSAAYLTTQHPRIEDPVHLSKLSVLPRSEYLYHY